MWPGSIRERSTRTDPITTTQAAVTVTRARRPTMMLERLWSGQSDRRTWSPSSSAAGVRPVGSVRSGRNPPSPRQAGAALDRGASRCPPDPWPCADVDAFSATATSTVTPTGATKYPSIGVARLALPQRRRARISIRRYQRFGGVELKRKLPKRNSVGSPTRRYALTSSNSESNERRGVDGETTGAGIAASGQPTLGGSRSEPARRRCYGVGTRRPCP